MRRLILPAIVFFGLTTAAFAAGEKEYVAGLAAMDKGDYPIAVKLFDKAIDTDEGNGQYFEARGVAKALAQDLNGATSDLKMAAKNLDPNDWEPKGWIGVVNRMAGRFDQGFTPGLAGRDNRDYALAMNDLGQNYGMSTTRGVYFDKQTRRNVQTNAPYTGDFAPVAHMFVQRHRGTSGDAGGATAGAVLDHVKELMAARDYPAALQELAPLVKANPDDPAVLIAEGECLAAVGNVIDARRVFTRALTHQSDSAEPYVGRALAAMAAGDGVQAVNDFNIAQKYDPTHAAWMHQQMQAAMKANVETDPQALAKQLQTLAAGTATDQINNTALHLVKAMEANRTRYDERYQQRRAELENALKQEPRNADRMADLGRFIYEESSIQSETVGPRGETILYRDQTDAMQKHDIAEAESMADAALALDAQNVSAMTLKAEILLDAKNFDDSEAWARKALAIKADDPNLLELLAKLLQVDASYKITAAGNLKQPKDLYETRFDEYPPMEYHWIIFPSAEELRQAAVYEQQAQEFSNLAQQTIDAAVKAGGRTKLGYYFEGTSEHAQGHLNEAMAAFTQAITLDPGFQKAWFEIAAIYTEEKDGDKATETRTHAMNITQTTDAPWLVAAWHKIPRGQLKGGRAALMEAAAIDPADPRIWAFIAVSDEAAGKRDAALAEWTMASAVSNAVLQLHGQTFGDPHPKVPPTAQQIGLSAMIEMRKALLELESGDAVLASRDFTLAANTLQSVDSSAGDVAVPDAMLPDPNLEAGVVPMAESLASMRIRAEAGKSYAMWAAASKDPQDKSLAAQTYRRMMVDYPLRTASMESFQAIADLGMAELHLKRGETDLARQRMRNAPAVPQDFWQEMRKVQNSL